MKLKADDYCYKEKRVHLRKKWISPVMIQAGNGVVECNAHCSIYSYTKETRDQILKAGTVRKFKPIHYSRILWIDADTCECGRELTDKLKELDISFDRYVSGRKGYHFAIEREAEPSEYLCYQDHDLVVDLLKTMTHFEDVDLSIYKPMGLIRSVGCRHEKTRRPKHLDMTFKGSTKLSVVGREVSSLQRYAASFTPPPPENSFDAIKLAVINANGNLHTKYHNLWTFAKDLFKAGLSEPTTLELLLNYNETFKDPKSSSEVERAMKDARRAVIK